MDSLLACFLSESRENLETAGRCFLELEKNPDNRALLDDLFRAVHTIKGSSGLFEMPYFTKVVHVAEDLLDRVRAGEVSLRAEHIDLFLEVMDQVAIWLDELEDEGSLGGDAMAISQNLSQELSLISPPSTEADEALSSALDLAEPEPLLSLPSESPSWLSALEEKQRADLFGRYYAADTTLLALEYVPAEDAFFSGEDPLHTVQNAPHLLWFGVTTQAPWLPLKERDLYQCNLSFYALSVATEDELKDYFRYQLEQVNVSVLALSELVFVSGEWGDEEPFELFLQQAPAVVMAEDWSRLAELIRPLLELSGAELRQTSVLRWLRLLLNQGCQTVELFRFLLVSMTQQELTWPEAVAVVAPSTQWDEEVSKISVAQKKASEQALQTQQHILALPCSDEALLGRIASVSTVVGNVMRLLSLPVEPVCRVRDQAQAERSLKPLLGFLQGLNLSADEPEDELENRPAKAAPAKSSPSLSVLPAPVEQRKADRRQAERRHEKEVVSKTLKVDQQRIDALMDLVGELVVAKNALPFLAKRAEEHFGVRQLAKEIKSQYTVINRLSEELQGAMMQIRMVPISTVFQRFPRLVRDLSRKLGKQVELKVEGEETEADKNVVENLADPLIHLVRNSLDHGLESAEERRAAGKPASGTIILRALGQDDQVVIEISDDGRGIDPEKIKKKAYQNGLLDEQSLDNISDHEALQLIFSAGLSTAEAVSDLSGRGVGMDVVRSVIQAAGGSVEVSSELGQGSTVRLSLPLSMAVTRVMMIEVAGQSYGISMENIVETVRVPREAVQRIKQSEALVLRERLIPLFSLRALLQLPARAQPPEEIAVLVMMLGKEEVALVIDEFHEGIDIIQKSLEGVMAHYPCYSGATLLGDGRVLLVLNTPELLACR
ncbi:MAG: chemotaxis protein CheA [Gammaproteobacteria bacterium]|nr:chemotaxis protein CheA [Gammaproteobacteria bacterium]